jgi:hypothetical protein
MSYGAEVKTRRVIQYHRGSKNVFTMWSTGTLVGTVRGIWVSKDSESNVDFTNINLHYLSDKTHLKKLFPDKDFCLYTGGPLCTGTVCVMTKIYTSTL